MSESIQYLTAEVERLRERDAVAQTLIGVMRYCLLSYDSEAGGKDFHLYREWKALDPVATEVQRG